MKFRLFIATAAAFVAVGGGTAGTALASTASPASAAQPAAVQLVSARGNVQQIQYNWWGMRIWLNHQGAQAAYQSVAAAGRLNNVSIPGVPSYISAPMEAYIHCTAQFVNDVRADDVGYGVVMDVNWWSPWWSCGTLKVWSQ